MEGIVIKTLMMGMRVNDEGGRDTSECGATIETGSAEEAGKVGAGLLWEGEEGWWAGEAGYSRDA